MLCARLEADGRTGVAEGDEAGCSSSPHRGDPPSSGEGGHEIQFLAGNPRVEQLRGCIRLFRQMSPAALAAAGDAAGRTTAAPPTSSATVPLEQLPVTPRRCTPST